MRCSISSWINADSSGLLWYRIEYHTHIFVATAIKNNLAPVNLGNELAMAISKAGDSQCWTDFE
jgi:hypothetical protein